MSTTSLVWIIVGIVVVLVILGGILYFARKRNREHVEKQRADDRRQAADLRQNAQNVELDAREAEAKASRARADAAQAEVDAERLRQESAQREADAQDLHVDSHEQLRQAETLDPAEDGRPRGNTTHTPPLTTDAPRRPDAGEDTVDNPRTDGRHSSDGQDTGEGSPRS